MTVVQLDPSILQMLVADADEQIAKCKQHLTQLRAERYGLALALARRTGQPAPKSPELLEHAAAKTVRDRQEPEATERPAVQGVPEPTSTPRRAPDHQVAVEWSGLTMVDAVQRVLTEADRPLGPQDIVALLENVGMTLEDTTGVRGALAYLKRPKPGKPARAALLGRGQWVLAGGPLDTSAQQTDPDENGELLGDLVNGPNNDEGPADEAGPVDHHHSQEAPGV